MENVDFSICKFIKENMWFFTYYDFCDNCKIIKSLYKYLHENAQLFYKWYVYANVHMNETFKNAIWEYLNEEDPIYYIRLMDLKRQYRVK